MRLRVTAKKLNKRKSIPITLPDSTNITGIVNKDVEFEGEEVVSVPNPSLGKWYRDRDGFFYWGGGVSVIEVPVNDQDVDLLNENKIALENSMITPAVKRKVEQVVNVFETSKKDGDYGALVTLVDHIDSQTGARSVQVTYGRSQTTEFGHLKELVKDYIEHQGMFANILVPYLDKIGKEPSLAHDNNFCQTLKKAGREDPIMKNCQDALFEQKYFQPAQTWFVNNGFVLPLSLLVIYDSFIHSGSILQFLRKRFSTPVPANGGAEKDWITDYVNVRHQWLSNHSVELLRHTAYRTACLLQQIKTQNWDLTQPIKVLGIEIA